MTATRLRLPDERRSVTRKFRIGAPRATDADDPARAALASAARALALTEVDSGGGDSGDVALVRLYEAALAFSRQDDGPVKGYVTVGLYADGRPGEVFIVLDRAGSTLRGMTDAAAQLASLLLQHGVPVEQIAEKFVGSKFDPSGPADNPHIPRCSSVLDYVFRWVLWRFRPVYYAERFGDAAQAKTT